METGFSQKSCSKPFESVTFDNLGSVRSKIIVI
ncbi:hypothetical protein BOSE127_10133 [Bosea sp. 127]|nr:hypothetical protein BOSE127_10133 [Bosea sp. 127]